MTNRASAKRYARALFDVSLKEADPQQVARDLTRFVALLEGHDTLQQVLENPAIPAARKRLLVTELAERLGVSPVLGKLLALLADRDRLVLLPLLKEAYEARLLDHLKVVRAEVTTAAPLDAAGRATVERGLAEVTGRRVEMTTSVAPEILGGVIARVGSTVYDGSLKRQLERMREKLAGGA